VAGRKFDNYSGRPWSDPEGEHDPQAVMPCPFERAILSRKCACRLAQRSSVESRQKVQCSSMEDQQDCAAMLNHMRKSVNFSLGLAHAPNALPREQATKLQCGTLLGLQNALDVVVENDRVNNIHETMQRAKKRYGSIEEFPEQEIIRRIACYGKD
jgi:hypothetical protein